MTDYHRRAWAQIDLDALEQNLVTIREKVAKDTMIMGVVKADAYGHGDRVIAQTLEAKGLVSWFGVSRLEEGLALREAGITLPILVFGITPVQYLKTMTDYQLVPTVHTLDYATELQQEAKKLKVTLPVHIKIDTGMSRMGFLVYDSMLSTSLDEIETIATFPNLELQGLYTHFAVSDRLSEDCKEYTAEQYTYYIEAKEQLEQRGITFPIYHCSNSAAIVNYPHMNLDMVRAGIIMYGLHPDADCVPYINLTPIMECYATVAGVKTIPAGRTVSYGREFTAPKPTTLANIGVGYADGYDRSFGGRGEMLLHGQRVPVVGRVCMDQLMLDVSHLDTVTVGDVVTLVGKDGEQEITFEQLATQTATIHYEKTSAIGKRVPRVYLRGGEVVDVTDLLRGHSCDWNGRALTEGRPNRK